MWKDVLRALTVLAVVGGMPGSATSALAQDDPCAERPFEPTGDDGFALLTDLVPRCEGKYVRTVSGNTIYFMAWEWSEIAYDLDSVEVLSVSWLVPDSVPLPFVVDVLPIGTDAYRLESVDSVRSPFVWPTTTMRRSGVDSRRFRSLTTWETDGVAAFVPVRVNPQGECAEERPRLVLYANEAITEIEVRVYDRARAQDPDGEPNAVAAVRGSRPRGRFRASLPELSEPGLYRIEVGARSRATTAPATAAPFWIYYPGAWETGCPKP